MRKENENETETEIQAAGDLHRIELQMCIRDRAYGIAKPAVRAILTGATQQVQENIAMLAGMILFTGFNYLGQRYFVFGEKNEEKTSNRPQV